MRNSVSLALLPESEMGSRLSNLKIDETIKNTIFPLLTKKAGKKMNLPSKLIQMLELNGMLKDAPRGAVPKIIRAILPNKAANDVILTYQVNVLGWADPDDMGYPHKRKSAKPSTETSSEVPVSSLQEEESFAS